MYDVSTWSVILAGRLKCKWTWASDSWFYPPTDRHTTSHESSYDYLAEASGCDSFSVTMEKPGQDHIFLLCLLTSNTRLGGILGSR